MIEAFNSKGQTDAIGFTLFINFFCGCVWHAVSKRNSYSTVTVKVKNTMTPGDSGRHSVKLVRVKERIIVQENGLRPPPPGPRTGGHAGRQQSGARGALNE
jgi:hypothetical protein